MSDIVDWSKDPPDSEERKETYRHEQHIVFRIHTRALEFLERRWREVKELSLRIPRQENKRKRLEGLIRNNLMCLLNTQANRLLLTHTGKLIYTSMGITYAGNGALKWKNRESKSPHENLWPTVLDHYDTYWNKYSVIVPDNDDLEVCQICNTTQNDEYTYDDTEQLMEEARLMVRTFGQSRKF
jgi:hypothetical protein